MLAPQALSWLERLGPEEVDCPTDKPLIIAPEQGQAGNPQIWDEWIVWYISNDAAVLSGNAPQDSDVYAYHIPSGRILTVATGPSLQSIPQVYGDIVTWRDFPSDGTQNFVGAMNLTTGKKWKLPIDLPGDLSPRGMYENRVLIEDYRGLHLFDLKTNQLSTIYEGNVEVVEIWKDRIVWTVYRAVSDTNTSYLAVYDLKSGQETRWLEGAEAAYHRPDLYEDLLVFQTSSTPASEEIGTWDIHMLDLATGQESNVSTDTGIEDIQQDPRIAGDWIVYGLGTRAPQQNALMAFHVPTARTLELEAKTLGVQDGSRAPQVGGDVWQNRVVWPSIDLRDPHQNIALLCLPEMA